MSQPETFISVFARNCSVRRITAELARPFMEENHRYGWSRCRHCYGLFITKKGGGKRDGSGSEALPLETMVAVSCFSNARRWEKEGRIVRSYEWIRYASLKGTRIQGGMSKMLKAFIEDEDPDDIMSYAPLDKGDEGEVYELLGFVKEGIKEFGEDKSAKYRFIVKNYR